jgi:hypothetical protein
VPEVSGAEMMSARTACVCAAALPSAPRARPGRYSGRVGGGASCLHWAQPSINPRVVGSRRLFRAGSFGVRTRRKRVVSS